MTKAKGKEDELPMEIPETELGKAVKEFSEIKAKISELQGESEKAKTEILGLMKEEKKQALTIYGLRLTIKPGEETLEIKKA